jgi:hypothetical protein
VEGFEDEAIASYEAASDEPLSQEEWEEFNPGVSYVDPDWQEQASPDTSTELPIAADDDEEESLAASETALNRFTSKFERLEETKRKPKLSITRPRLTQIVKEELASLITESWLFPTMEEDVEQWDGATSFGKVPMSVSIVETDNGDKVFRVELPDNYYGRGEKGQVAHVKKHGMFNFIHATWDAMNAGEGDGRSGFGMGAKASIAGGLF